MLIHIANNNNYVTRCILLSKPLNDLVVCGVLKNVQRYVLQIFIDIEVLLLIQFDVVMRSTS